MAFEPEKFAQKLCAYIKEKEMKASFDFSIVDEILSSYQCSQQAIIAILQDIQEHYHYLPKEIVPYLSEKLGMSEG